jgi:hypothetical protein
MTTARHEAVPTQHQNAVVVINDSRDGGSVKTNDMVLEALDAWRLDIDADQAYPAVLVDAAFAVDPPGRERIRRLSH